MISLERREDRPLRIGHRGAATLAPENTLRAFRAAVEAGVDLIEFDVNSLSSGELVVAHSNDLHEVSHGAARGTVLDKSLAELRDLCPELPTLDDALRYFVDEAPALGVHLDLKITARERDVVEALRGHGLEGQSFVSTGYLRTARAIAEQSSTVRTGITVPRGFLGISDDGRGALFAGPGLRVLRRMSPTFVAPLLSLTRATALVLHHSAISSATVRAAHARGVPVVAWTVDDPAELARLDDAGVDAIVTNDPRIFTSTLKS